MDGISAKFPSHKFIGEEETSEGKAAELTDAPTWIIDVRIIFLLCPNHKSFENHSNFSLLMEQ